MKDVSFEGGDLHYEERVINSRALRRALARQSQEYRDFRDANRSFRRAFGRGERHRKILLACAEAKLKEKS